MQSNSLIYWTRIVYLIFILLWLLVIIWLQLYNYGILVIILLFIPVIVFASGYLFAHQFTPKDEESVFEASFLAIGLLVLMPLVNWMKDDYVGSKKELIRLIFVAVVLTLLSVLDIWLPKRLMRINKHIRLCLETMAVTLFICIIVMFYDHVEDDTGKNSEMSTCDTIA